MKRFPVLALIGLFAVAFAAHPAVHALDGGAHACLLSTAADRAEAPIIARPLFLPSGDNSLFTSCATFPAAPRLWDARGPPL